MDARSAARLAAVEALYEQDISAVEVVAEKKLKHLKTTAKGVRVNKKIFESVLKSFSENAEKIDKKITDNLADNWKLDRIGGVVRAVLRAALAESLAGGGTPKPLIISEYVNITASFYDDGEVKFVNGILEKVL